MGAEQGDVMVALAGRVPTHFDNSNGEVKPGDLLTTTADGRAMKQTEPGATVGKALENSEGKSEIIVFVAAGWDTPNAISKADLSNLTVEEVSFTGTLHVAGAVTFDSSLTVGGSLNVSGAVTQTYTKQGTMTVGSAVYISGNNTVAQASADGSTGPAVGIVAEMNGDGTVDVAIAGTVKGMSGLTAGRTYYVGAKVGAVRDSAPTAAGQVVQAIGVAQSGSAMLVMPSLDTRIIPGSAIGNGTTPGAQ
jgi:hypothetical protein